MIQSTLIEELSRHYPLLRNNIGLCIRTIENEMINQLIQKGRIEIRGFGSFEMRYHRKRLARNPKTGEQFITGPKYAVRFKPGKELRERVNSSRCVLIKKSKDK